MDIKKMTPIKLKTECFPSIKDPHKHDFVGGICEECGGSEEVISMIIEFVNEMVALKPKWSRCKPEKESE